MFHLYYSVAVPMYMYYVLMHKRLICVCISVCIMLACARGWLSRNFYTFTIRSFRQLKNEMDVKEEVKRQVNERAEMECQLATNKPNFYLTELSLRNSRSCPAMPKSIYFLKRYIWCSICSDLVIGTQ